MNDVVFSKLKPAEKFARKWIERGFDHSDLTTEYRFHPTRKWRFDFAWPSLKVAVEIDGFGYGHQSQQGISAQNEKRNAAVELGWHVLVYDSRLIGSHQRAEEAVDQVCRLLESKHKARDVSYEVVLPID